MRLYDHAASCNCYKVRLLAAQLGLAYERVPVDIFAGETLTPEFARLNPARATPVLETDDGRFLTESNAILVYLACGTPLSAADPFDLADIMRWLLWEQADLVPAVGGLRFRLLTGRLVATDPDAVRRADIGRAVLGLLDDHLQDREFLAAGRYTVADIAVYGYTHRAGEAGLDLEPHESLRRWLSRVDARPGYIEDVAPYAPNARPGSGRSIYD